MGLDRQWSWLGGNICGDVEGVYGAVRLEAVASKAALAAKVTHFDEATS